MTHFSNVEKSEANYRTKVQCGEIADQTWSQDWMKVYIAEVEVAKKDIPDEFTARGFDDDNDANVLRLPVAAMALCGSSPQYTRSVIPAQDELMYV